jgi:predicted metal-binding protein
MENDQRLIDLTLAEGAAKAAIIPGDQVVLSASFRDICATNACGRYGRCYMCPPDVGDIEDLMKKVRQFSRMLIYQTISPLEDSFDYEGMTKAGYNHAQLSQRLMDRLPELLPSGYLHLASGGCRLCESCRKLEDKPCVYPDRALPSVSGYGIDVYNTVKGIELKYINGPNTVTYFGMVLYNPQEA